MSRSIVVATALAFTGFLSSPAHAGIDACGNIDVEASAKCKVEVEGGCTAQCEPVRFTAACAGKLYAECKGGCDVDVGDCSVMCQGGCTGECDADPGNFECEGSCQASCDGNCSGQCSASDNKAQCEAACKATCSGECEGSCDGTPPSATCEAKCEGSCEGRCKAEVNLTCQIDCQAQGQVACEAELEGGCTAQCQKPEGALFCDGQYVDHGGNLESCIAALNAILSVKVDASASGSCSGNKCEGEAEGSVSCALSRPSESSAAGLGSLLLALGLFGLRRRG